MGMVSKKHVAQYIVDQKQPIDCRNTQMGSQEETSHSGGKIGNLAAQLVTCAEPESHIRPSSGYVAGR